MSGDFLPVQLVYQGKTPKCLPSIEFPKQWHLTYTPNHWCNEETMIQYIKRIFIPYVQNKKELGLPSTHPTQFSMNLRVKPQMWY